MSKRKMKSKMKLKNQQNDSEIDKKRRKNE